MQHFQQRVIAVCEHLVIRFHDRSAPEVARAVFFLELHDPMHDVFEKRPHVFRGFAGLCCVLRQVLEYGPQVDQWTPVDVAKV